MNQYSSPQRTTSQRGRFINGVWHCDCEPRLPAAHFETKKGGLNHGRWFYTCQKPQSKRCKFFLWDDDAEVREKQAVLANVRSEPDTPKKQSSTQSSSTRFGGLLTPATGRAQAEPRHRDIAQTPTKIRKTHDLSSDEDTYSWDESLDNEVGDLMSSSTARLRQPVFSPSTPNRTPRTAMHNTSPRKRNFDNFDDQPPPYSESVPSSQSNITTSTVPFSFSSVEVSATPTPRRYQDVLSARGSSTDRSELSMNVLSILDRHDVVVPTTARDEVAAFLNQQHLKTKGIIRGRDMSWLALKKKDEEIKSLKERIESLEAEREMDRVVISCLRSGKRP